MARDLAERQAAVRKQHAEPQLDRGPDSVETEDPGEPETAVEAATLQRLNQQLYRWPATFHINTKLAKQLAKRRAALGDEDGRDRVGARRGAGLRLAAGRRGADPPHRPGHRARHLQPAAPDPLGRQDRRRLHPDPAPGGRQGGVRAAQQPAERVRGRRLRVRLRGHRAGGAGAVGGAVRRLRERRRDHHRPVHHRRPGQVAADLAPDPAAAPRLRGIRSGALLRPPGALPGAGRGGQHPRRLPDHAGAVLPPAAAPGAPRRPAPADRDDAEVAAAPAGGRIAAG